MHYCNPAFDELDDAQAAELDKTKRVDMLVEAANIVNDDMAFGAIVFRESLAGGQIRVHTFFPNRYAILWSVGRFWIAR